MGESQTSQRRIEAVEKQKQALEYRKMGYTYDQIAEAVGFSSASGAHFAVKSALRRTVQEPADAVRKLELERLDAMFVQPYQRAVQGDLAAISTCLTLMQRRATLQGIDIVKVEHSGADGSPLVPPAILSLGIGFDDGGPGSAPRAEPPPGSEADPGAAGAP